MSGDQRPDAQQRDPLLTGLREVRDSDAEELVALIGGVFAEYPGCVLDLDELDADLLAPRTAFAAAGARLWVLERDGAIVACVGLGWSSGSGRPGRVAELKRLYVAAEARGLGLGRALVDHVHDVAITHGADAIELWSDTRFHDAHRLYLRAGYRQRGLERDLDDPSHTTEAAFWRPLAADPPLPSDGP